MMMFVFAIGFSISFIIGYFVGNSSIIKEHNELIDEFDEQQHHNEILEDRVYYLNQTIGLYKKQIKSARRRPNFIYKV